MKSDLPPETRLWVTLDRVHNILARRIHNKMAELDLTAPQYGVLRRLSEGGPQSASALASDMGVTPGNLTGVIDRLEQLGLLRRDRGAEDRRSVQLHLTEQGQAKCTHSIPEVRRFVGALFSPLGAEEVGRWQAALERLEAQLCAQGEAVGA